MEVAWAPRRAELGEGGGTRRTTVTVGAAWLSADSGTVAASEQIRWAVIITSMARSETMFECLLWGVPRSSNNVAHSREVSDTPREVGDTGI